MTATDAVVAFVVDAALDEFPPGVVGAATAPIVDTIGVMAAGVTDHAGAAVLRYAASRGHRGDAPWTGISAGTPPDVTALVNSTLVHALDFDDVLPGAGHPSGPVLSAILATAAVPGVSLSGRGLLEAYVVGIEVMRALARAVGPRHYQRGWHTTSTIGGFAAAAAAAKVLELDKTAVARALGLAATMACGLQRNFGTATKPLHSGFAAANGVTAALLARTGFTAAEDALDGPRGFLDLYSDGGSRPEEIDRLGTSYALLTPGISLKKYACCFEVYRPIDAVLELRAQSGLAVGDIRELRCTVPPGTTGPLINRWPDDGVGAKFSLEFALAAALVDGAITIDTFDDDGPARPELRAVLGAIHIEEDVRTRPDDPLGLESSASSGGFVEVIAVSNDGSRETAVVYDAPGTPARPLSDSDIDAKFMACLATGGRSERDATGLLARLRKLGAEPDIAALLRDPAP